MNTTTTIMLTPTIQLQTNHPTPQQPPKNQRSRQDQETTTKPPDVAWKPNSMPAPVQKHVCHPLKSTTPHQNQPPKQEWSNKSRQGKQYPDAP